MDSETLLKHADEAMYHAKRKRNTFCSYNNNLQADSKSCFSVNANFRFLEFPMTALGRLLLPLFIKRWCCLAIFACHFFDKNILCKWP